MKTAFATISLLTVAAAAPAAGQSVRDFQLPPAPTPTPTQSPQVQGPIDSDAPVTTAPRVIPTATPSAARTQAVEPIPTPTPVRTQPAPIRTPTSRATPSPAPAAAPTRAPQVPGAVPETIATPETQLPNLPQPDTSRSQATPSISTAPLPTFDAEQPIDGNPFAWWTWLLAALLGVAAFAGGLWFLRNRQYAPENVPTIEPPLARRPIPPQSPVPEPEPEPEPGPTSGASDLQFAAGDAQLVIDAVPVTLSRSMRFVRFTYRVTLKNRGTSALEKVVIGSDLTTAHGSVPAANQLADPSTILPETGTVGAVQPGEEIEVSGEVELPLSEIRTIRQGQAHLYVPLLRVRAVPRGSDPVARTFMVGTLPVPTAQKLQPFRLDEMPQTYTNIGMAPLDR